MNVCYWHRVFLLIVFICSAELCCSQHVPYNQLKQIENKIRRLREHCDNEKTILIDGPIEPEKWYDKNKRIHPSEYRIVFVLKEAYGADNQGVLRLDSIQKEYSSLLSMGAREGRPTYTPLVAIANMLVMNQSYNQVQINSTNAYSIFKESSAIVEVKKEYGTPESSDSNIRRHASENKDLIEEQIRVYNPNVVIICGNNLYEGIFIEGSKVFGVNTNGVGKLRVSSKFRYYYNDHCIYINTYHPSYPSYPFSQITITDYCTEIVEVVRKWMEENEE